MTPEEATRLSGRLRDFNALVANRAWKEEIQPLLERAVEVHLKGVTDRSKTPEKRSEHLEAYHLALELRDVPEKRMRALDEALREWAKHEREVASEVLDRLTE